MNLTVRSICLLLLILLAPVAAASSKFEAVDQKVRSYPKSFSSSASLAARINADFSDDLSRTRALFYWMANHITYDMNAYNQSKRIAYSYTTEEDRLHKERLFRTSLARKTLTSGKAICEGYATLFVEVCRELNIEAVIITGAARSHYSQIGKLPLISDHAWNAVRINNRWLLLDVAWAAGAVDSQKRFIAAFNDAYFGTAPSKFALNHFPDDPQWLFTEKTPQEFATAPFYHAAHINSDVVFSISQGTIRTSGNRQIKIHIENLEPTDRLTFTTSERSLLRPLQVDAADNVYIVPGVRGEGYFTIFINQKPYVTYKVSKS